MRPLPQGTRRRPDRHVRSRDQHGRHDLNPVTRAGLPDTARRSADHTSTPGGKLIFHVFGALAEFERDLIRERTLAGLAAARARGRTGGRPTVWTPEKLTVARQMYDSHEHDVAAIARVVGVSRASVYQVLTQTDMDEPSS
ncbi:recombinase family protein [Pedococcus sp. 2YAF34]|uniref:recombinase family protein n=1 Tax=Pedococcus sp. 2YAF34 TaxID=3233032 RepID=UPI003F9C13E8